MQNNVFQKCVSFLHDIYENSSHNSTLISLFMGNKNIASLFLKPIDEEAIKSIVINGKSKSSLDSDNISMYLIHQTTVYYQTFDLNVQFIFQNWYIPRQKLYQFIRVEKRLSYLIPSNSINMKYHIIITTIV